MSLQSYLNQDLINKLPLIKQKISELTDNHWRNQLFCMTLQESLNSSVPVDFMSESQKNKFQLRLLDIFECLTVLDNHRLKHYGETFPTTKVRLESHD